MLSYLRFYYGILIIGMLLSLPGCRSQMFSEDSWLAPMPARMGRPAENASALYKKGWWDGCHTGLSTMNMDIYKNFYGYKQDISLIGNPEYYKSWKDAYTYCRQYSFRFTWDPLDRKRGQGLLSNGPLCVLCPNEVR